MSPKELIVALDFPSQEEAMAMARTLSGHVRWLKVGLELFCRTGPDIVSQLEALGFKIFLDLKFMDIPNTVRGAVASASASGAHMLTIHLMGGEAMARAALQGVQESGSNRPLIVGVTVLTSMTPSDLALITDKPRDMGDTVVSLARQARNWGLDGIVCSGQEVQRVRHHSPQPFAIVTPGIRLGNHAAPDDQKRVATPEAALHAGSDYIVVGRPITRSTDPIQSAQRFLEAMKERS